MFDWKDSVVVKALESYAAVVHEADYSPQGIVETASAHHFLIAL